MRDAVSLLDQCSVCAEEITAETVSQTAGIAGRDFLYDVLDAVFSSDAPKALEITSRLYDMSKDLTRLCEELILQLRNIMLMIASPSAAADIITAMPDELERLKKIADSSDLDTVMSRLAQLQSCRERMGRVMNKRVEFEMTLIKLCGNIPETSTGTSFADITGLLEKIKMLENRLNNAPAAVRNAPRRREFGPGPVHLHEK